ARGAIAARSLRVMTRENLVVLLVNSGRSVSDCIDKCEIETGRLVGADFVLSGVILRFGDELRLSMRLHETRGGTLLAGETAGRRCTDRSASARSRGSRPSAASTSPSRPR